MPTAYAVAASSIQFLAEHDTTRARFAEIVQAVGLLPGYASDETLQGALATELQVDAKVLTQRWRAWCLTGKE